jgi:hypothetical protein
MSVKPYFEFKGVKYGIGTIVHIPRSLKLLNLPKEQLIVKAKFIGGAKFIFQDVQGYINLYEGSGHFSGNYAQYIKIIEPVYYEEQEPTKPQNIFLQTESGSWDAYNQVCMGLVWYILIMVIGAIFQDRLMIWAFATIVFFVWKSKK